MILTIIVSVRKINQQLVSCLPSAVIEKPISLSGAESGKGGGGRGGGGGRARADAEKGEDDYEFGVRCQNAARRNLFLHSLHAPFH